MPYSKYTCKEVNCRAPHDLELPHVYCTVKCPYCKRLVDAQETCYVDPKKSPDGDKSWMIHCTPCDVYTIIPK